MSIKLEHTFKVVKKNVHLNLDSVEDGQRLRENSIDSWWSAVFIQNLHIPQNLIVKSHYRSL